MCATFVIVKKMHKTNHPMGENSLNLVTLLATWDRCYDFLNIFAKKFGEKIGVLAQNKA
jgi:hypothetical protein